LYIQRRRLCSSKEKIYFEMRRIFDILANKLFGDIASKYEKNFAWLKDELKRANKPVLLKVYLAKSFFITALAYFISALTLTTILTILKASFLVILISFFTIPFLVASITFFGAIRYPKEVSISREKNINSILPFAINHMSAIAISGAPNIALFESIKNFSEYGEIANEAAKIVKKVKVFGQDIRTAIKEVAKYSPSNDFHDLLYAILGTMEKGGDLKSLLKEKADSYLFNYKFRRRKAIQNISTYMTIYVGLIFLSPLILALIFALLATIGGDIVGISFKELFTIMPIAIIILNIFFLLVLNLAQSDVGW
jgi:flagellar protein FlaJ